MPIGNNGEFNPRYNPIPWVYNVAGGVFEPQDQATGGGGGGGGLTDAQLRAAAVVVTGDKTHNTAPDATNVGALVALASETGYIAAEGNLVALSVDLGGSLRVADFELASQTLPLVTAGGGGYVRQDSTATIAKESGGNLATLVTEAGAVTEAAPATDTASSGLNGRLQRIAQRLTSLLAVFPTTIDVNSGNKSASTLRVVLATDQPALTNKLLVTPDSVALPANQSVNVNQVAGTTADTNSGVKSAGTLRVVLATDQPALTNKLLVTPDSVALPANQSVNVNQLAGTATDVNSGNKSAGTLRVVLATDQPQLTNKLLVTPDANSAINVAQVGGSAVSTAAAGVQKVGVTGNAGASIDAATAAAVPANALHTGARAATANPANATGGNMVSVMADKAGRLVVTKAHARDLVSHQQTNVAVNTETTIVTAGGAGVFNDLVQLIITTAGLAAQTITIKDATAGTTRFVLNYPNAAVAPGTPMILNFDPPIPQATANANWTVTQSLGTACNYTARFVKNT